jgi:hypothetical protein
MRQRQPFAYWTSMASGWQVSVMTPLALEQIQEKWKPLLRPDTGGVPPPFLRLTKELERFRDSRENGPAGPQ